MLIRILAGLFLIAHGLVHLIFLIPDVREFAFEGSRVLPASSERTIGQVLMYVVVGVFALAGLAVLGVPGLAGVWPALTIAGSVVSLVLLVAFWSSQMVVGVAIDVALIVIAVVQPGFTDGWG